ncbi:hypothetical protein BDV26DRAFT_115638 [Aspergillus bertholletiae]|uniref:Uncharacterized protein n=1 Tax=Aspergillus bertholletiae TaxID=1226010 RepID=A0A5N7BGM3_9EURO|nr:hypothetical protein BDV26DRAFT_115638 [Aspergillus bertholletiae]
MYSKHTSSFSRPHLSFTLPELASPSSTRKLRTDGSTEASPLSSQSIFNEVIRKIPTIRGFIELVFESIPPEQGSLICHSLRESSVCEARNARINFNSCTGTLWVRVMPTELHDVHQRWINYCRSRWTREGLTTEDEDRLIDVGVGTTFDAFTGKYTHSSKEPDLFLRPDTNHLPLIVVESGWSESWPRLHADKDLWLYGSTEVNMVVLLKWSKLSRNRGKGNLEVWTRNPAGGLTMHKKSIFPEPIPALDRGTDVLQFTKLDLFGQQMIAGQDPNAVLPLDLFHLRNFARERMLAMGLTPA